MKESEQLIIEIPGVALPLVLMAYLCIGEAWVQSRIQTRHRRVGKWRHLLMLTCWPLAWMRFTFRWWWIRGKALYARLRA